MNVLTNNIRQVCVCGQLEALLRELSYVIRERDVELRPHAAQFFTCRYDITQSYQSLSHMVSCYNQVHTSTNTHTLLWIQLRVILPVQHLSAARQYNVL